MGGKAKGTRQMAIAGNSWTDVDDASLRNCQGGQQQLGVVGGPPGRNWSFPSSAYELHALPPSHKQRTNKSSQSPLAWHSLITSD
jgi:hypothetical protein